MRSSWETDNRNSRSRPWARLRFSPRVLMASASSASSGYSCLFTGTVAARLPPAIWRVALDRSDDGGADAAGERGGDDDAGEEHHPGHEDEVVDAVDGARHVARDHQDAPRPTRASRRRVSARWPADRLSGWATNTTWPTLPATVSPARKAPDVEDRPHQGSRDAVAASPSGPSPTSVSRSKAPTRRRPVDVARLGEDGVRRHEAPDGLGLGGDLVLRRGDGGPPNEEEAADDGEDEGADDDREDGDGDATAHEQRASAQPVPDPPHRGEGQAVAELLAQLPDVDVDGALVAVPALAPHAVEQLLP